MCHIATNGSDFWSFIFACIHYFGTRKAFVWPIVAYLIRANGIFFVRRKLCCEKARPEFPKDSVAAFTLRPPIHNQLARCVREQKKIISWIIRKFAWTQTKWVSVAAMKPTVINNNSEAPQSVHHEQQQPQPQPQPQHQHQHQPPMDNSTSNDGSNAGGSDQSRRFPHYRVSSQ